MVPLHLLNLKVEKDMPQFNIENGKGYGAVESPSGTLCYFLSIINGKIDLSYIVTPSLFGFKAIADSLVNQIFTDFVFTKLIQHLW